MSDTINMHDAKTHLSKLVQRALDGEEIIISRDGKPLVKLTPVADGPTVKRQYGRLKGQVWMADDFDSPLPPDIQRYFDGESDPEDEI